jgi:hypothetical protein
MQVDAMERFQRSAVRVDEPRAFHAGLMPCALRTAVTHAVLKLSSSSPASLVNTEASFGFFSLAASSRSHSKTASSRAEPIGKTRPFQLFVVCPRSTMSRRPQSMSPKRSDSSPLPQASTREQRAGRFMIPASFSRPHVANPVEDR